MTPQQLRLIADIIEFNMPCRVTIDGALYTVAPFSLTLGRGGVTVELTPGDGYEFVDFREAIGTDEVYTITCGWIPNGASPRDPDGLYRRKRPVHPPFGDPPDGYTWHNPDNLTPEQVGTADGWRLCCKEETANLPDEGWLLGKKAWVSPIGATSDKYQKTEATYRTKAPLPMTERQKFDEWFNSQYVTQHVTDPLRSTIFAAWKAAKQSK